MTEETDGKAGWWQRLRGGLGKSAARLTEGITGLFTKRKLDAEALADLEEVLIGADLGPVVSAKLVEEFGRTRFGKDVTDAEVKSALAGQITDLLAPVAQPLAIDPANKPFVVLMVGVNGAGKTTTIGKLAKQWQREGRKVMLVAGDTFRAAAVSQLQIWGERARCPVVVGAPNSDPAALAFQGLARAQAEGADILLIDTAGRLQNKDGLMQELAKVVRVLKKQDDTAPHATLLVLDATSGQNAHSQVEVFREMVAVSGLIVTKLDGSARGGVLVALAQKFGLPVHCVGVGEGIDDLRPFAAADFARALMGME